MGIMGIRINMFNKSKRFYQKFIIFWPADFHLLKVNNRNTRKRYEICSKRTIKTPKRRHWRRSGVFINFEHILHLSVVFLLSTFNKQMLARYNFLSSSFKEKNLNKNSDSLKSFDKTNKFTSTQNKPCIWLKSIKVCIQNPPSVNWKLSALIF